MTKATFASPRVWNSQRVRLRLERPEPTLLEVSPSKPMTPDGPWRHVAEWSDDSGTVIAAGAVAGNLRRMELIGVGTFEWDTREGPVTVQTPEVCWRSIEDAFSRSVLPFVLHTRGTQVLHASGVLGPRGLNVICARSGSGKSTIAYAMSQRQDMALWADDAVAIDVSTTEVSSLPLPFSLRLRPASARHFDREDEPMVEGTAHEEPVAVAALVVLDRGAKVGDADVVVDRLTDVRAFVSVLEHAYCFSLEGDHGRTTSDAYLSLVTRVPVYSLRFAGRLDVIPTIVDELVRLG
jgi:hypothetical protein